MKALNMIFQMRYGSPVCYVKWLCGSPKYGAQGDPSGSSQPPIDIRTKVALQYMLLIQCSFCFGVNYLTCHPLLS